MKKHDCDKDKKIRELENKIWELGFNQREEDKKKRAPYNLWVGTVSIFIFLIMGLFGAFIVSLGVTADQEGIISSEYHTCSSDDVNNKTSEYYKICHLELSSGGDVEYNIIYSPIETRSNPADVFCRFLAIILGVAIAIFGGWCGINYFEKKSWSE